MKHISLLVVLGALLATTACSSSSSSSHYAGVWDEAFSQAMAPAPVIRMKNNQ